MKKLHRIRGVLTVACWLASGVTLPAQTFFVTTTNDFGPGSLREAINAANTNANTNSIHFNIPGAGPHTIQPTNPLPQIFAPVIIDGYTQPGSSSNTLVSGNDARLMIELDGTSAGTGNFAYGLDLQNAYNVVRGLVINRFRRSGIRAAKFAIGCRVQGNFIGTGVYGTNQLPNLVNGIEWQASLGTIGGGTPAARNVISGNALNGISVGDPENVVQGNYIGTDATGTKTLGNGAVGILLFDSINLVGGTNAEQRNLISGNGQDGIQIGGTNNRVQGNFIGTDVNGMVAGMGNHGAGIWILGWNNNTIGMQLNRTNQTVLNVPGAGNLIAGNFGDGVFISGDSTATNTTGGFGNSVLGNSIHSNGPGTNRLGIDLLPYYETEGVSTNDSGSDVDGGGNKMQNYPVLTSALSQAGSITIQGTLDSSPNTVFTLEFFANTLCNDSGFGEGENYIGRTNVMTGAGGQINFSVTLPFSVSGDYITATATDPGGNTSEFSRCAVSGGSAGASPATITSTVVQGNNLCLTWTAAGGTTNYVQAAPVAAGPFTNISGPFVLPPGPQATTNYCEVNATLTRPDSRYYRILTLK